MSHKERALYKLGNYLRKYSKSVRAVYQWLSCECNTYGIVLHIKVDPMLAYRNPRLLPGTIHLVLDSEKDLQHAV